MSRNFYSQKNEDGQSFPSLPAPDSFDSFSMLPDLSLPENQTNSCSRSPVTASRLSETLEKYVKIYSTGNLLCM